MSSAPVHDQHATTAGRHRARWAAIGAAVAVSLGAGGVGLVKAAQTTGPMPIYREISPCRLADTRPGGDHVGDIPGALSGGSTTNVAAADGAAHGDCTLPAGATALAVNATALDASEATFIQFAPGGTLTPGESSSLNPTPGQPPTPNAVNVPVAADGSFDVYNLNGNVHLILDVVGYYVDHEHTGEDIVNHSVSSSKTSNEAGIVSTFFDPAGELAIETNTLVATAEIRVPSDGYVNVSVTGVWHPWTDGGVDRGRCQLTMDTTIDTDAPFMYLTDFDSTHGGWVGFSGHATMPISAADNPQLIINGQDINLVCTESNGDVRIVNAHITGEFFPTSYSPAIFTLPPIIGPISP